MRSITPAVVLASFLVLLMSLVPLSALGDDDAGNKLLAQCQDAERLLGRGQTETGGLTIEFAEAEQCLSYLQGVTELNRLYRDLGLGVDNQRKMSMAFCTPATGVSKAQLARVVVKFLKAHPERLHEPRIVLAWLALSDAFSCSRR